MATSLDSVCDLFTTLISDYKLTALYSSSGSSGLNNYLESFLLFSIDEFSDLCSQDLTYSTTTQTFDATLTQKNKNVLAQIMVKYWLQKELQDVLQMRLHLQDRDFRSFAESNNLREKRELYNMKREEISQMLNDYGYRNFVDWDEWDDQDFR